MVEHSTNNPMVECSNPVNGTKKLYKKWFCPSSTGEDHSTHNLKIEHLNLVNGTKSYQRRWLCPGSAAVHDGRLMYCWLSFCNDGNIKKGLHFQKKTVEIIENIRTGHD